MNNTETYWEADGRSLHTYAHSIETLSNIAIPNFRGENDVVPLTPGATWVEKVPDQNVITLGMWARGVDPDAGGGASQATKRQYQKNYHDLVRMFWNPRRQVALTKRFYDGDGDDPISATALVEYAGGLAPTMIGNNAGKFTVDLRLADPFFYADTLLEVPLVNGDNIIEVPGDAPTLNAMFTINGARTNTRILNKTNEFQFTYPQAVLAGEYVRIEPKTYDAFHKPVNAPEYDASTRVIWQGGYQWMQLEHGTNVIHVQSTSGAGVINLQARGAWV
jgi:hypothetical protein